MLSVFPKRKYLWIAAAATMAAGCATPPGGHGLHAAALPAATIRPVSPRHAAPTAPSRSGVLEGVSCARSAACVAVGLGIGRKPGRFLPLAEAWDGTNWHVLKVPPLPRGSVGGLDDVSCSSASRCLAVGTAARGRTSTGIAESWNGVTWQRMRIRFPIGTAHSSLTGVSCRRRTCMIVGAYRRQPSSGGVLPLAILLRGTRLRLLPPRVPRGRKFAELAGVSCASASRCIAVGGYFTPSVIRGPHSHTLAETWNGAGWRVIHTPTPNRAPDSELGFVSCPDAARCMATGSVDFLTAATTRPLTEAWDAGRWHVLRNSGARVPGFFPFGVSCGSARSCIAVGSTAAARTDHPGAERWNGRTLLALPVPQPAEGHLNGVSCATANYCVAVGEAGRVMLAELWNGKNWHVLRAQP